MSSASSVPLSAEISLPTEREKHHLEPKSYVDAVKEGSPTNCIRHTNGTSRAAANKSTTLNGFESEPKHTAPVLKIVDTGGEGEEEVMEPGMKQEEKRPKLAFHIYFQKYGKFYNIRMDFMNILDQSSKIILFIKFPRIKIYLTY